MPITAKFVADFDDFYAGVQKAEVELRSFEANAGKVGTALDRMVDSFSGRKVIQDAALMVEAVERIGGATKLTTAEFDKLQRTVTEAAVKMKAMGIEVPAKMQAITASTATAATSVAKVGTTVASTGIAIGGFAASLGNVDKILGVFGVRIGPAVGALGELAAITGTTTTALGLFGTTMAALAVGATTFKITRSILDMTIGLENLDGAIANSVSKLMGWGDLAAQTAGAKADMLARASETAGRQITSLTEAERINREAADAMADADRKAAEEKKTLAEEAKKAREEFVKRWEADVARGNEASVKAAADYRKFLNFTGEREIEDHARMLEAKARDEAEWRRYQNMLGERALEDEGKRLEAEAAAHKKAAEAFMALEKTKYQDFVSISQPLNQAVVAFDQAGKVLPPPTPGNLLMYGEEGKQTPMIALPSTAPMSNVNINMNGMLLSNDPSSLDLLRRTVQGAFTDSFLRSRKVSGF